MRSLQLLFIALAVMLCAAPAWAQDCSLKEVASLDLLPNARPVIAITIGGKPYHFLIDTGGVTSTIDSRVAAALGQKSAAIEDYELYGAEGDQPKRQVHVDDVRIGDIHADHLNLVVTNRDSGDEFDGTLAPDVLMRYDAEFDFSAHKFKLFSQDHCPGHAVYWTTDFADADFQKNSMHVVLKTTLDGHDLNAILDTGSTDTMLSEHVAHEAYGLGDDSPGMETDKGAPGHVKSRYRFKSLSVGDLGVANPLVHILPDLAEKAFRSNHNGKSERDPIYRDDLNAPALILGMNVLSKLHIYISYKEDKVYFTGANAK